MVKRKHDPGYKLPEVINPEKNCCICIPIPNDFNHKMAFLGQLDELGYWWNWERDPDHKGTQAAQVWRTIVECIREDLNMSDCGCGDDKPTNTRINPDTGIYEVSYDGGITWEPAPGDDPRSSGTTFPPVPGDPGDVLRCQTANSVVGWIKEQQEAELEGLNNNATVAEFITLLIGALAAIGLAFALVPAAIAALLAFVVNTLAKAIPAEFEAHFTETKWQQLLCVVYCAAEDDGSFTEAGWQEVKNEALAMVGGYAGQWMYDHINLIGVVGLTNAGRSSYPATRSCDECACSNECIDPDRILIGTLVSQNETGIVIQAEFTTYNGHAAWWVLYGSESSDYCCMNCGFTAEPEFTSAGWVDCDGGVHATNPASAFVRNVRGYNDFGTFQASVTMNTGDGCPE